jgi:hypothetical protein
MQGCYQAGVVYWQGEGAQKDIEAGKALLKIACDGGFDDACVALKTLVAEVKSTHITHQNIRTSMRKNNQYTGYLDGKFHADIDSDGKVETIGWKKFASTDLGDYYQLLVIDDEGSLLWEGPKEKDDGNPLIFFSLDFGVSMPELLIDFDNDGFIELLAPVPQSDVSPTYYRKLRWRGTYFEPLFSNALMLSALRSDQFVWRTTSQSYGTWVSKLAHQGSGLVKANVVEYTKNGSFQVGQALIRFDREGAKVERWLQPISHNTKKTKHKKAVKVIGVVYGLDPNGDGFLSIRKKPGSAEIGRLYNGNRVKVLDRSGKWYKIKDLKSGRVGWSHSNWIKIN